VSHILIVEDERHLAEGLRFNLEAEGDRITLAESGEAGLTAFHAAPADFDLIMLDVMLPGKDGFAVAAELRQERHYVPILMLTARGSAEDVLRGFAAGADDYLAKPFELAILRARIGGLLRRKRWQQLPHAGDDVYDFAGRHVDFSKLELSVGDRRLPLTLMEANLLRHLIRHRGEVVSRKAMLEEVWGLKEATDTRAIDNFVVRLRKYLEDDPKRPRHLLTVRGVGYRFEPDRAS
jgi:two-component system alkaline phosphatase synthesis response regulator PhoP